MAGPLHRYAARIGSHVGYRREGAAAPLLLRKGVGSVSGLQKRFYVRRYDNRDAPGGDREGTSYFVLDPANDPAARKALKFYALNSDNPDLVRDLWRWLDKL